MGKIPMVYSESTLSFFINGLPYQVDATMSTFEDVKDELRKPDPDVERLIALTQPAEAIRRMVEEAEDDVADYLPKGTFQVTRNSVSYNGEPIHGVLVDRILAMLDDGFDIMPMVRFMENLFMNPADFARDELYLWLETSNLPITEDGHFLAYKNVNGDFTSIHDGRTKNDPGRVVSMPRHAVDADRDRTCSRGLHFCSKSYLPHFSSGRDNKTILLKINPADVVSIPSDYNNAKGRAWKYEVLEVVDDPQTREWPSVVAADASPVTFDPGSAQAKKLFGLLHDLGINERGARLDWATDVLDRRINSFNELVQSEVNDLLDEAQRISEERVDAVLEFAAERQRIAELGIIELRREASRKGLKGAWKGFSSQALRDYLLNG